MIPRILAFFAVLVVAAPSFAQQRFIVRAPAQAAHSLVARYGLNIERLEQVDNFVLALVSDPARRPADQLAASAGADHDLAGFEADQSVALPAPASLQLNQSTVAILDGTSTSAYFGSSVLAGYLTQPASNIIGIPLARSLATGGGTVAVIDTGVDPNHPVLAGYLDRGYDFIRNEAGFASELAGLGSAPAPSNGQSANAFYWPNQSTVAILDQSTVAILDEWKPGPAFGHGTMVAGLVRLVAPTARIMPLRTFQSDGTGSLFDVIRAIYFAVGNGARVINMSFSVAVPSRELDAAISYANSRRVICIASAGNSGSQVMVYPAGFRKVEGVGSTTDDDKPAPFTNTGDNLVTVAAPGIALITAYPLNNYAAASGTSFSAALVSGAAALLVEIDPRVNQAQAAAALSQAVPVPLLGAGRIDLLQACLYMRRQ